MIIEIEDKNGNTLCYFRVKDTITDLNNCEVADVEDDYFFNTDEPLKRIQLIEVV